jgi:nucleotide-binding universal stress UspA family protein
MTMYSHILVPLDGSGLAEQALPYVRILAQSLKSEVKLLRVIDRVPPDLADPDHGLFLDRVALSLRNEAEEYLDQIASSFRDDGIAVSNAVHESESASGVASLIIEEAESQPDALIAMTTHGRSGWTRWLFGSVSDKILRAATRPLFLIRCTKNQVSSNEKIESLLVSLDGSDLAEQVLPHAVAIARSLNLETSLLRVTFGIEGGDPRVSLKEKREPDPEAVAYLGKIADRLRQEGITSVNIPTAFSEDPSEVIVDRANELPNCIVAVTSHGRSGIRRRYFASVTDRVSSHCGGPLLLVRALAE